MLFSEILRYAFHVMLDLLKICLVGTFLGFFTYSGYYWTKKVLDSQLFQTLRERAHHAHQQAQVGLLPQERHGVEVRAPPPPAVPMLNVPPPEVPLDNSQKRKNYSVNHPEKHGLKPKSQKKYYSSPKNKEKFS